MMLGTDMNTKLLGAAAFAALGLSATSTLAATCVSVGAVGPDTFTANCTQVIGSVTETVQITTQTLSSVGGFSDTLKPTGFTMITNFNGPGIPTVASGFLVGGGAFDTGNNSSGANPPGDNSQYESVLPASPFTLTDTDGALSKVAFVMGSPDDGNSGLLNDLSLTISGLGGAFTLTGSDVWGGQPTGGGDQGAGFLVTYTFMPNTVTSLEFSQTGGPAFEFDNISGMQAGVPEPASWALMIMGFGAAGGLLRSQRRKAALA